MKVSHIMVRHKPIVTRFAPSPTGYLHIGGCRTALFNWLFAKSQGGSFMLRIEDTDVVRSTQKAKDAIIEGLKWLGIEYDGDIIWQSKNIKRHREIGEMLVTNGKAYRCYATQEELKAMREEAQAKGLPLRYDRRWRDRSIEEAPQNAPYTIRIKMPLEGSTEIKDLVQGDVKIDHQQLDDFILLRADGSSTYMLSVVVDDHDMGVTHVIRGDDHLNNAFRQYHVFKACGFEVPEFAHIPLIHGRDGAKLSKRHGALGIGEWREQGFLPEAMINYFLRLGWSHGDQEIMTRDDALKWFKVENIGRSPARFDLDKLNFLNAHYLRSHDDHRLLEFISQNHKINYTPTQKQRLQKGLNSLKMRAKNLVELSQAASVYLYAPVWPFDDLKAQEFVKGEHHDILLTLKAIFDELQIWDKHHIEQAIRHWCDEHDIALKKVAQPLRAAICGSLSSPGIFEVIDILGKKETIKRLDHVI
ncbi:MAG: glutamate--tRNA ligase [Pseudomonadota bacterium]